MDKNISILITLRLVFGLLKLDFAILW